MQDTLPLAIEQAQKLKLKDHPHSGADPVPAFHTAEELAAAAALSKRRKTVIKKATPPKRALPFDGLPISAPPTPPAVEKPLKKGATVKTLKPAAEVQEEGKEADWQVCRLRPSVFDNPSVLISVMHFSTPA